MRRCVVVAGASAAVLGVVAGPAFAHIEVVPDSVPKGAERRVVSFSVPNERDDKGTTEVSVQLPADQPLTFVRVQPKSGWTVAVDKDGDRASTITWSGGQIGPGEFELFSILIGPVPDDVGKLEFPTLQTYSDGEVVRWIEASKKGAPEPEFPAPILKLTKKVAGGHADDGHDD